MIHLLFAVLTSLTLMSCGFDDNQNVYLEIVPVSVIEMPTKYKVDSITQIPISYIRPTVCHQFSNFYYNSIGNERTVAVYCLTNGQQNCAASTNEITVPLNFKPKAIGTYNFRFWTGEDDNGVNQYMEYEITVDH